MHVLARPAELSFVGILYQFFLISKSTQLEIYISLNYITVTPMEDGMKELEYEGMRQREYKNFLFILLLHTLEICLAVYDQK